MTDQELYEQIDTPFYRDKIAPLLPEKVLDFHTHIWLDEHWKDQPAWEKDSPGTKYMVLDEQCSAESMLGTISRAFPDRLYEIVTFGMPSPAVKLAESNDYAEESARKHPGIYPLLMAGGDLIPEDEIRRLIPDGGYYGYKVFLNWFGNDYGHLTIEDMIGPNEMRLANELGLVVLLHVPRDGRLADPVVQEGVRRLSREYPNSSIVLAHCGRAYLPDEMSAAIGAVADLDNVYLDTAMVMEPQVIEMVFDRIDSSRVLYASDLPVAAMRGRRVYLADHWVDLVWEGYSSSAYRVPSKNMRATLMVYEIILAVSRAARMAGLTDKQAKALFHDNGMALLNKARRGDDSA